MAEQLTYGDSKTPFYPLIENGITLIELNSSITDLVTSSSPEDIEQAFDGEEVFDNLIAALRLSGTVINGITIATDTEAGNMTADVVVSKNENKVVIRWIDENYQYVLTVTKSAEGTFSCTKTSLLLGSEVDLSNYLSKTNTSSYTPTNNYNPATKKYVDDNIVASFNITSIDGTTASFSQENYNKLVEAITNNQNIIIVYLDNSNNTTKSLVSSAVNSEGNITLKTHSINNENGDITYNEFVILGSTFTNNVTINSKTFQLVKSDEVLTKTNTDEFIPTEDYHPATKKYMDDKVNIPIINAEISDTDDDITGDYTLNIPNNNTQVYLVNLGVLGYVPLVGYYVSGDKVFYYRYSGYLKREDGTGNKMNNALYYITINGTDLHIELKQLILTESEYSALGTTPNTDNVLYFIIPDA